MGGHPRAGGGATKGVLNTALAKGPSPRGRGSLRLLLRVDHKYGAIPARAGEPETAAAR